jgi:hypothetical protein
MVAVLNELRPKNFYFFPFEPDFPVLVGLDLGVALLRPFPEGFPVVLGAFFNPLDFAIILGFKIYNTSNI